MSILITTSRRPTRRVRTFIKELERMIPCAVKRQRGKSSLRDLKDFMIINGFTKLMIVETWKGNPGRIQFFHLRNGMLRRDLVVRIESLSLQIDAREKKSCSELFVKIDEKHGDDEQLNKLYSYFKEFFEEDILENRWGQPCILLLTRRMNKIAVQFMDSCGRKRIRPWFTLDSVEWRE